MLTVLPVSPSGVTYGIRALKSWVKRYEDNVVTLIQIGGEEDEENPYSETSFIVLMVDKFTFTAFVSDRGTLPPKEDYSGTGSQAYEEFREIIINFQGKVSGIPRISTSNSRPVNQHGIRGSGIGFSWKEFFEYAYRDANYENAEELEEDFSRGHHGTDWRMNIYRIFLINAVFIYLYKFID